MIGEIEYPGVSSTRTFAGTRFRWGGGNRHRAHVGVIEGAPAHANNPESTATVGIGAGDEGIGGHPVVGVGLPLFGGEEGQESGQGIQREALPGGEPQVLSMQLEGITGPVIADHGQTRGLFDFNAEVEQAECRPGGWLRFRGPGLHST